VIPTLNAGPLFRRVLASLRRQTGVGEIEIIVLDSGSMDETCELATGAGASVVRLRPSTFGHGRTRNEGIELATGDRLVMLTQDALLLGPLALQKLVLELEAEGSKAAVSARQVPRSDADLYASYVVLTHELVFRQAAAGARRRSYRDLSPVERRAVAAVDDVCAVIRRDAWEELRFRDLDFGEDVDFGIRAIERGWTVAVSEAAAVAHSHTRDAVYTLRRSAADRIWVAPLFDDGHETRAAKYDPDVILSGARLLVFDLAGALARGDLGVASLTQHLRAVRGTLRLGGPAAPAPGLLELAEFLHAADAAGPQIEKCAQLLRDEVEAVLSWPPLGRFARAHSSVGPEDVGPFVAKIAGAVIGRTVGDAIRRTSDFAMRSWLLEGV
jgi:rhamnosyltransferase